MEGALNLSVIGMRLQMVLLKVSGHVLLSVVTVSQPPFYPLSPQLSSMLTWFFFFCTVAFLVL